MKSEEKEKKKKKERGEKRKPKKDWKKKGKGTAHRPNILASRRSPSVFTFVSSERSVILTEQKENIGRRKIREEIQAFRSYENRAS